MKKNETAPEEITVSTKFLRDDRLSLTTKGAYLVMKAYDHGCPTLDEMSKLLDVEKPVLMLMLAELFNAGYFNEEGSFDGTEDLLFSLGED